MNRVRLPDVKYQLTHVALAWIQVRLPPEVQPRGANITEQESQARTCQASYLQAKRKMPTKVWQSSCAQKSQKKTTVNSCEIEIRPMWWFVKCVWVLWYFLRQACYFVLPPHSRELHAYQSLLLPLCCESNLNEGSYCTSCTPHCLWLIFYNLLSMMWKGSATVMNQQGTIPQICSFHQL